MNCAQERGVFKACQDKRMAGKRKRPSGSPRRLLREHSPTLTWLSLVGLHPCRAQLRFTRQRHYTSRRRPRLKIDKSAYRLARFKIDKSAYRLGAKQQATFTLDKLKPLV
jgi:hypothetical protein